VSKEIIDNIIDNMGRTHLIVNSEAGHGKTTLVKNLIRELKEAEPKTIVKVFDVSQRWSETSPLPYRQKIDPQTLIDLFNGKISFTNLNDCVYEMGSLDEDSRRFFVSTIIKQDYESRYNMAEEYGIVSVEKLPRIIFVFEEADTYFDSTGLNTKRGYTLLLVGKSGKYSINIDNPAGRLRDFIKVGRNFGLRGLCIVTACVGELGTKLRRRSKHLIGKIISDSDYREYNRMKRWKRDKRVFGLGDLARENPAYHWIYYNGEYMSQPFMIDDLVRNEPQDYEIEKVYPWEGLPVGMVARAETRRPTVEQPENIPFWKWVLFFALLALVWAILT